MKTKFSAAIAGIALLLGACSENPVTGEKELSIVSPAQEIAIGEANYAPSQQAQGGRYHLDPALQDYVREVGMKLAAVSDRPDLPYEFVVLNNSVPNAWALPGGKIAINRGLLTHLDDECELAAVMGHEIVHAAARHSASQMTRGTFLGIGAQVLGIALADSDYSQLANIAAQVGAAAWMARYGREAELEADAYGMRYMAAAGYDPTGAVRLQETFVELSKDRESDFLSGLFASHPPSQKRVEANRELAATLPGGNCFRKRYLAATEQIRIDEPAYALQGEATAALEAKKPDVALAYLEDAIDHQPAEGYFWELRGHAYKMQKDFNTAEDDFSRAIERNPELFSHHLARGVLRYEQGRRQEARPDLQRSHELLPTQVSGYLLGELSLAANDRQAALQFYEQAAGSGGKLGEKAAAQIARLELPEIPHKYLVSQAYVAGDGYLHVAVRNQSGIAVRGIAVRLDRMADAYTVAASRVLRVPRPLQPGEQLSIATGLGPFENAEQARYFRTRVVRARPARH